MSTLPIVARELRVRSRLAATAWTRVLVAGVALLFVVGLLLTADSSVGRNQVGRAVFHSLSWVLFLFVLVFGVWLTHDSLSGERREGTLGLLFLTDLRALDVVLGKLTAAGLTAVYAILALVPPLAVTLMAGGVTGGEVLRSGLALLNALFGGMSLGLWVSSRQEDESRSLMHGLGWLAVWAILPFLPDVVVAGSNYAPEQGEISLLSPLVAHVLSQSAAYGSGADRFWISLATVHFLSWCGIGMAAGRARNCWRDGTREGGVNTAVKRRTSRAFKAEDDPLNWLATRHLHARRRAWLAVLLMSLPSLTPLLYALWFNPSRAPGLLAAVSYLAFLFYLIAVVMLASLVCRPIAEGRQSGLLQMLQTTPLRASGFVEACWRGLRRIVLPPVLAFALLGAGIRLVLSMPWYGSNITFSFGGWVGVALNFAGNVLFVWALVWTGMWEATRAPKPGRAVMRTLLWVVVLPVLASMLSV
ncbi:MAG: ABC transporter permease subunit, partial [Verrucomicrobiae bacterium]|nr:ABC transporter permease subunit [Verrucomicrobiae bacterium]